MANYETVIYEKVEQKIFRRPRGGGLSLYISIRYLPAWRIGPGGPKPRLRGIT